MNQLVTRRRWLASGLIAPWLSPAAWLSPMQMSSAEAADQQPPITCLTFTPDGDRIVAGSQHGVAIRDPGSGVTTDALTCDMDNVHDLQLSRDGQRLAVAGGIPGETGVVEFYSWPDRKRVQRLESHGDVIYSLDFAADRSRWAAASGDEVCSVFAEHEKNPTVRFTEHSRPVLAVRFLHDANTIVSASRDQTLRVWNATTGENIRTLHNHSRDVHALALAPATTGLPIIASASADLTVRLWQPTIGRMVRFARLDSEPLCICWIDAGRRIVAGCRDGKARLIDPLSVKVTDTIDVSAGWLFSAALDPSNERRLAFGTLDGQTPVVTL